MTKEIPLSQGKTALVDDEDYDWLMQYNWFAHYDGCNWYARRNTLNGIILMHRLILNMRNKTQKCDHINGDGLDNRRCNLRIVTDAQNAMNRKKYKNTTSKYKGVSWYPRYNKWMVYISKDTLRLTLGYFIDEVEAAKTYDVKAKILFGEYAKLNFPEELK